MNERLVIDAGPIIAFGKMEAFDIIERLPFDIIAPKQVFEEIAVGSAMGHKVTIPEFIRMDRLLNAPASPLLASLDAGEAAVIELAIQREISLVCIDEKKGRRTAIASGLRIVGSLGLLNTSKKFGLVPLIRPLIMRAQQSGIYYNKELVETFLSSIGE